ncbi:hypothetical protein DOY81_006350 [Sarcophaga bullata]|nr:hypothetical protein DOY81_006350 [Sarcophaga bullata]
MVYTVKNKYYVTFIVINNQQTTAFFSYKISNTFITVFVFQSDFDQQLENAGDKLVVVDFFATWCGPCKMIAPKLEELSKDYADKVVIIKVDVDDCEDIAMEYNISSMPTFIFIKNKQKIEEFAGANAEKLTNTIQKLA